MQTTGFALVMMWTLIVCALRQGTPGVQEVGDAVREQLTESQTLEYVHTISYIEVIFDLLQFSYTE